jgi:DNA (cytosine-5)-methyltransferase 1
VTLDAVSLFTNCGAGDVGYRAAGFRFVVLAELLQHRLDVAALNHPGSEVVVGDLRKTLSEVVAAWRRRRGNARPALLAACPPCQGMSSARSGRGKESDAAAGSRDPRNLLVEVVAQAVNELRPRTLVVENVPAFLTRCVEDPRTQEPISAARLLSERLEDRYDHAEVVADLADFGVPQSRRRSFLTFVARDEPGLACLRTFGLAPYPAARTDTVSLRDALREMRLPPLDASSASDARDPDRPFHVVPVWNPDRYGMVAAVPTGRAATAWENTRCRKCGDIEVGEDDAMCGACGGPLLRPVFREADGSYRLIKGFRRSSYARMDPSRPAATVTTASGRIGSDNTIHPFQNRVLSVLECQLLQTIPPDFQWGDALEKKGHTGVRAMIGEAVPPAFTRQHGRVLRALLEGRRPYLAMRADDERIVRATRLLDGGHRDQSASPTTASTET